MKYGTKVKLKKGTALYRVEKADDIHVVIRNPRNGVQKIVEVSQVKVI